MGYLTQRSGCGPGHAPGAGGLKIGIGALLVYLRWRNIAVVGNPAFLVVVHRMANVHVAICIETLRRGLRRRYLFYEGAFLHVLLGFGELDGV